MAEPRKFAQEVRDFDGDVYLRLPGAKVAFVKVDKNDLAEAGDHHGDLWVLGKLGDKAIILTNNEPPVGKLA